jgi:nucleoside-diphosphate-sugar epimerase
VLRVLSELCGTELEADHQPGRPGEVPHSQADIGRVAETFGYGVSVPFAEGLRRTYEYMLEAQPPRAVAR